VDNVSLFDQQGDSEGGPSGALVPFEFPMTGEPIRAALLDGQPWLVAPDVCMILKHSNVTMAVKGLDEDERRVVYRGSSEALNFPDLFADQRIQSVTLINESGFYALAFRSKVEKAKEFRKWVTSDVLPSLRRTGSYSIPQPRRELTNRELAMMVIEEADRADRAEAKAVQAERKVLELEPKAEQADHFRSADGLQSIGDFANDIKAWAKRTHGVTVKHKQVWDFLAHLKLIIRGNTIRHNHPTAFATDNDYVRLKQSTFSRSSGSEGVSASPRLTNDGAGYAWDRMTRYIAEHGTLELG
jgi:anti-repressor protein